MRQAISFRLSGKERKRLQRHDNPIVTQSRIDTLIVTQLEKRAKKNPDMTLADFLKTVESVLEYLSTE